MKHVETMNFSQNFNGKLFCDCFISLRLNSSKYYVGNEFSVSLNKTQTFGVYEILEKKVLKMRDVNEWMSRLDCGLSVADFRLAISNMYCNTLSIDDADFALILLKKKL